MPRRPRQLSFDDKSFFKTQDEFGGSTLKSNPKTTRPMDSKLPLHVVLRAKHSVFRLPTTYAYVNGLVHKIAKQNGIQIYKYANVGNHIHLAIRGVKPQIWARFIRILTGTLALKLKKFLKISEPFWNGRPYTRVVRSWKSAFQKVLRYIDLNIIESEQNISRALARKLQKIYFSNSC